MPGRLEPLITGEFYHVFNRGINHGVTFLTDQNYLRAIQTLLFYRYSDLPIRLSRFLDYTPTRQVEFISLLGNFECEVKILCYCMMPNHFHLLLRQEKDGGISKFLGNFQNSYTRYFNTMNKRDGSLFLDQFKAKVVGSQEELIHVSRYIHLNPYTGFVVKSAEELFSYSWSSVSEYLGKGSSGIDTRQVLGSFRDRDEYRQFVYGNLEYQRDLGLIKHLFFD
ncbi:MAG: transposase [Patescibacteria group bacterium]